MIIYFPEKARYKWHETFIQFLYGEQIRDQVCYFASVLLPIMELILFDEG
jgi:hypothetical protein